MLTTETEAREKWCAHVRLMDVGINRTEQQPRGTNCIGSQCMAWRWKNRRNRPLDQGYCGLAGKP